MIQKKIENFSLRQICESGQCFRMQEAGPDVYTVIAGGRYLEVRQNGANICFDCENQEFEAFWSEYFDLNGD